MSTNPDPGGEALRRAEARLATATVCVLGGGTSGEEEVSRASAERMAAALEAAPPGDARGPARVLRVGIEADGAWRVEGERMAPTRALLALGDVDLFVLGLHGGAGEDGTLQGLLRSAGARHTGTGVRGSALAMDKVFARTQVEAAGLAVPRAHWFDRNVWERERAARLDALAPLGETSGWVVKPRCGGSSVAASVVEDPAGLAEAIERALALEPEVLVEERVRGIEVTGGVLEGEAGPEALPVVEIRPRAGAFFDYEEKYAADGALELCPAESLAPEQERAVRAGALLAHRVLAAEHYSRADFLLRPDGAHAGTPVFLELNTLPGMTERSLLPRAAGVAGLDYRDLCLRIAALALRD